VVDPEILASEVADLSAVGVAVSPERLVVSAAAHLVTPLHRVLDARLNAKIGTTGRGIGPCYTDKAQRTGIRLESIADGTWKDRMREHTARYARTCRELCEAGFVDVESSIGLLEPFVATLRPLIGDPVPLIHRTQQAGGNVLYEGAQGTFLDVDHGTYPFVTSSTTTIGGALSGGGVYVPFDRRIAVLKAYTTRVGEGPFPTELADATGDRLREVGREYGATTGRPRRCGWLDLHLCQRAFVVNGFNYIALTKLDCLSGMPTVRVAVGRYPDGTPEYVHVPGWEASIAGATSFAELPSQAQRYVELIEHSLGAPVGMISTGPDRHDTIIREQP
jgi:adenylosuccinate synthase